MGKKRPKERTCMGCGRKASKAELFRVVVQEKGSILFDLKQQKPGRGGYFCPDERCILKAVKKKRKLDLRLRTEVVFNPEVLMNDIRQRIYKEVKQNSKFRNKLNDNQKILEGLSLEDLQIIISNKDLKYRSICRG